MSTRRRFRIYVAGPIQGANVLETIANMEHGNQWTAKVFAAGFSPFPVFCDMTFLQKVRPIPHIEAVYEYSLTWMRVADAVLLIPGWAASRGANAERREAERLGKPVFESMDELCDWADQLLVAEQRDPVRDALATLARSDD